MDTKSILEICTEKGYKYAQEVGCAIYNLKHGFWRVLEIGEEIEQSKQRKEKKIKEKEDKISKTKLEIDTKSTNVETIDKELKRLKIERNSFTNKINSKEKLIKHHKDELKKGNGASRRDNFDYRFIRFILPLATVAIVFVYFYLWYNSLFVSYDNANTYTSIFDPNFLTTAFREGNYFGLIISPVLVALTLLVSYFFHFFLSNKKKTIAIGLLLLILSVDILLSYRVVKHTFLSQKFLGDTNLINVNFSVSQILNVEFGLLLSISFVTYLLWGLAYLRLKHLSKPDEQIQDTIKQLQEEIIALTNDLDECNSNIKIKEENSHNVKNNIDSLEKSLEESEKELEKIKIKPIIIELDLKMKVENFYVGFHKAYRENSSRGQSESELEKEMKDKDLIIKEFMDEVKKSGKYLFN